MHYHINIRNNQFKNFINGAVLVLIVVVSGCKKLVEVEIPKTGVNSINVFKNDITAAAVLTGIYSKLSGNTFSSNGLSSISLFAALSADELNLHTDVTSTTL